MKISRLGYAAGAAAALLLLTAAPATATAKSPASLKASVLARAHTSAVAAALPAGGAGNGIFQVYVEQAPGLGVGSFTVLTGANHPAGAGRDVLFGGGVPGTSFMTVRDLTSGLDYVQGQYLTTANERSLDDAYPRVEALGTTGFHTGYYLPTKGGGIAYLDQYVVVHGTTLADSSVEVTTKITGTTDTVQVQYLWDTAAGTDDSPVFQTTAAGVGYQPFATPTTHEATTTGVDSVALADNNGPAPTLSYGLTGTGPARITPPPTPPQSVQYVCWTRAVGAAPGAYETDPTIDVATSAADCGDSSGPDSAVRYLFAPTSSPDRSTVQASASLFSSPAPLDPTSIKVAPATLGSPSLSATLTDTLYQHPVAGRILTFTAGGKTLCSAVTGADGVAACGGTAEGLAALLGYSGTFTGDGIWAASTGKR